VCRKRVWWNGLKWNELDDEKGIVLVGGGDGCSYTVPCSRRALGMVAPL
jgi:hypothetical protein